MLVPYLQIARFDHWFKNVFVLPGVAVAAFAEPDIWSAQLVWKVVVALLATGLVASSNYVINEVLDAERDAAHPVKKYRPVPSGKVNIRVAYVEWVILAVTGLALASILNLAFFWTALALLIMGCAYNIRPIRTKDKPYLDVLSESINNPLRLLLGWYATGINVVPPLSLVMAYWMLGAFFMAVKRFAEYRQINDTTVASAYRSSFAHYNEERLLISTNYYGVAFGLFFGIFLIRYRMELLVSIPFLAGFIAWYVHLGFKADSPTQYPEQLYRQYSFMLYLVGCLVLMVTLLFVDLPWLRDLFEPTISVQD